jgi:hypothetical protein
MHFLLGRTLRLESLLRRYSADRQSLFDDLRGRTVALVGNARSLTESDHGHAIDQSGLVIRINRAPMPSTRTHGRRTDWLALAVRPAAADLDRLHPRRILWLSHKRKRLGFSTATSPGFYLYPAADFRRLSAELGAPPTTGLMMADFLSRSDLQSLTLYGFDFFASLSLTGRRTADQVPHDFAVEKRWVNALIARDPRVRLAGR